MDHKDFEDLGDGQPSKDLPPREGYARIMLDGGVLFYSCGACSAELVKLGALEEREGILHPTKRIMDATCAVAKHRGGSFMLDVGAFVGEQRLEEQTLIVTTTSADLMVACQVLLFVLGSEHNTKKSGASNGGTRH